MTDTPTGPMAELIERLEKAKEGSRGLDAAIHALIAKRGNAFYRWSGLQAKTDRDLWPEYCAQRAPEYTTSIDAALSLVPEGFAIEKLGLWPGHGASVTVLGTHKGSDGQFWHVGDDGRWSATASTAPLALCIAALKAKESTHDR